MFSFIDEITKSTGIPFDILKNGFRVINFSNKSIYIENFTNIMEFSNSSITIKLKKGIVNITGEDLLIKNLNIGSIIINGKIDKMEIN